MNNLEICKRMGEIEKLNGEFATHKNGHQGRRYIDGSFSPYDPLTDDALCFQLMIKYKLSLIAPEGEQTNWDCVISDILTCDENPNKAICLAIIELKKGK